MQLETVISALPPSLTIVLAYATILLTIEIRYWKHYRNAEFAFDYIYVPVGLCAHSYDTLWGRYATRDQGKRAAACQL